MLRVRSLVGVAAALIATPLMGLPAWGAACTAGSVNLYTGFNGTVQTGNFSCDVGPLTFSNMFLQSHNVTFNDPAIVPFIVDGEFGLQLSYSATATLTKDADFSWTFDVTGPGIVDAFARLTGSVQNGGVASLVETVADASNTALGQIHLSLPSPFEQTLLFPAQQFVAVSKNQHNFVVPEGVTVDGGLSFSETSLLVNAFSLVPGPIAGAGVPGLVAACGGLLALARRRRRQTA
jgi:hypothetical protein